jgi:hypothetical protein
MRLLAPDSRPLTHHSLGLQTCLFLVHLFMLEFQVNPSPQSHSVTSFGGIQHFSHLCMYQPMGQSMSRGCRRKKEDVCVCVSGVFE